MNTKLYSKPPKILRKLTFKGILALIGPGAIIASVTIGSGELVWASRSGALFGTELLWVFLLAGTLKGVQVYSSTRYITLTGEHPLTAWNRTRALRWWFPLLFIVIPTFFAMPLGFSGIAETLGFYILRLFQIGESDNALGFWGFHEFMGNFTATIILMGCFLLSVATDLKRLERISLFVMGILLVSLLIAVVTLKPSMIEILEGLVPGSVPDYHPWVYEKYSDTVVTRSKWSELALYLTAVGGGTYDYLGYVGLIREKKWGLAGRSTATKEELERTFSENSLQLKWAKKWVNAPLLDTASSFSLVILVTLLFVILGSSVLFPSQQVPVGNDLLGTQEVFLGLLHPNMVWVYRIGVFLAFIGTLYGAFEIYRHSMLETVRAFKVRHMSKTLIRKIRLYTGLYCLIGALLLIWLPETLSGNIVDRMVLSAVVGGAFTCGLWCFGMLIINTVHLPKALRMGKLLTLAVYTAGGILTFLGCISLWDYFTG